MRALTEAEVRASLVNATADERENLELPHDFVLIEWDYLDFLAWRDPASGRRGYLVVQNEDGVKGVVLRANDTGRGGSGMCNICHTLQPSSQVVLFAARRAGTAGERGDTVGTHMCADLSCHDNVRLAHPLAPNEVRAPGQVDLRLDGTRRRMESFAARVDESR